MFTDIRPPYEQTFEPRSNYRKTPLHVLVDRFETTIPEKPGVVFHELNVSGMHMTTITIRPQEGIASGIIINLNANAFTPGLMIKLNLDTEEDVYIYYRDENGDVVAPRATTIINGETEYVHRYMDRLTLNVYMHRHPRLILTPETLIVSEEDSQPLVWNIIGLVTLPESESETFRRLFERH